MARRARWMRLGSVAVGEFRAACVGLSGSQARAAAPIAVWACARPVRADDPGYLFAIIAPAALVPGRAARWLAWALSPAIATYRDFGLRAYLDEADICLHGRRIGSGHAEVVGNCAVITSNLLASFAALAPRAIVGHATKFRVWLREGLGLAMTQWNDEGGASVERVFEAALRARIEAQHGWQFETAWPSAGERAALREAHGEPAQPALS